MAITTYDMYSNRLGAFASSVSAALATRESHALADNVIPFNKAERQAMEPARNALKANHRLAEYNNGVPSVGPVTSQDIAANRATNEAKDFQPKGQSAFSPLPTPTNS